MIDGTSKRYDVAVIGLGGMGSATLAHAAKRGGRTIGLEQFTRGHALGSSTGESRIVRQAYFEEPAYVPLLRRAYELWRELEAEAAVSLLDLCGMLAVGRSDGTILGGALRAARMHDLRVDELDRADVARRYPTLRLRDDEVGVFEHDAGIVTPELAIDAHLRIAERAGAELRFQTAVSGYASRPDGIHVTLEDGSEIVAARLVICAGGWIGQVARELGLPIVLQRNVQLWFEPTTNAYAIERFPIFFLERPDHLPAALYGFPDRGTGVKAGLHGYGPVTTADDLDRAISERDVAPVRDALESWMPGAAGALLRGKACTYAMTPDEHFILDRHPTDDRVVIAGGFSGHGFKFCSVVGEILTDLALEGGTRHPIGFLRLERLTDTARA